MRFHSRQAVEDFGFEIITSWDDGIYGSHTVIYRWRETGWLTSNCGEIDPETGEAKTIYRSGDQYVGRAYYSEYWRTDTYTLDPENDPILRNLVKKAMKRDRWIEQAQQSEIPTEYQEFLIRHYDKTQRYADATPVEYMRRYFGDSCVSRVHVNPHHATVLRDMLDLDELAPIGGDE